MPMTVRDICGNADLFRAAYPHWPHAEPEADAARCAECGHLPGCPCPHFCMTAADAAERERLAARETRRRELARRTKTQLVAMVNRTLIGSMHPPSKWTREELITHVLDGEFPAPAVAEG